MLLKHETEPSFCLVIFDLGNSKRAKVVVYRELEGNLQTAKLLAVKEALSEIAKSRIELPESANAYFLGNLPSEFRFLIGMPLKQPHNFLELLQHLIGA